MTLSIFITHFFMAAFLNCVREVEKHDKYNEQSLID